MNKQEKIRTIATNVRTSTRKQKNDSAEKEFAEVMQRAFAEYESYCASKRIKAGIARRKVIK